VVATGTFQIPSITSFSRGLSGDIIQLHSSQYKNPDQLIDGNVLVIGGGNSGAQIAVELSKDRETYLACSGKPIYLPLSVGGKSVFWWFDKFGILKANDKSILGRLLQQRGDPIFGYDLKTAIHNNKVIIKDRVTGAKEIQIIFEDTSTLEVSNVIWATGFKTEFPWLKIDGLLNKEGKIVHERGVSNIQGLSFVGLPWQYRRGSALLQGVGYDAEYIVRQIVSNNLASTIGLKR